MAGSTTPVADAFNIRWVESLRPGGVLSLPGGGSFRRWAEDVSGGETVIETEGGAPVFLRSADVFYVCGCPDEVAMARMLGQLADAAGLEVAEMPGGPRRRETDRAVYLINYGADAVSFEGRDVPALDVRRCRKN